MWLFPKKIYKNYAETRIYLIKIPTSIRGANKLIKEKTPLAAYELGLIKNSLRERLVTLENYRTEYLNNDSDDANEKVEMSINIDSFKMELKELKDKIDLMTETQSTKTNLQ